MTMKTITLNLPEPVAELYPKIGDKVFLVALRESARRLIREEQKNLKSIKKRMKLLFHFYYIILLQHFNNIKYFSAINFIYARLF